jgi:hypothetical protein
MLAVAVAVAEWMIFSIPVTETPEPIALAPLPERIKLE